MPPSSKCPHFALLAAADAPTEVAAPFCKHEHSVVPLALLKYVPEAELFLLCNGDIRDCQLLPRHRMDVQLRALQ